MIDDLNVIRQFPLDGNAPCSGTVPGELVGPKYEAGSPSLLERHDQPAGWKTPALTPAMIQCIIQEINIYLSGR
jgi:hypothetical protein